MENDKLFIRREVNIQLYSVAGFACAAKSRKRIFGDAVAMQSAMGKIPVFLKEIKGSARAPARRYQKNIYAEYQQKRAEYYRNNHFFSSAFLSGMLSPWRTKAMVTNASATNTVA